MSPNRQKPQRVAEDEKSRALRESSTLNPFPEKVGDAKFGEGDFFDPRDMVQVKYEMLRRVSVDNASIKDASEEYGVSRPTYYQARANLEADGIAGLLPRKRGPRRAHKLTGDVLAFLQDQVIAGEPLHARKLAARLLEKFDLNVHPRTIERALLGNKTPK